MSAFVLSEGPVDLPALHAALQHPGSGGFCSFEGWVRNANEGRAVSGLEYETYAELAEREGQQVVDEAIQRYGVLAAQCVHRTGDLKIGELAVWIGVSAAHRDEAFRACRYIIDEIKHRLPIWKKEHYLEGDTAWVACSHTERAHEHEDEPAHDHAHHHHDAGETGSADPARDGSALAFTPDYSRQTRLAQVGVAGQAQLAAARVLVIGAGGLGCPVLSYLAGAGVGMLGIVDADVLDASNLHRQVIYNAADVGQRKVELAARRIAELNPQVRVQTYTEPLQPHNVVETFGQYDLIVECTDDLGSRYLCSDAAVLAGKPLVLASVYQYEGQLQVVTGQPGDPCLRCLWPEQPAPGLAGSCVESGVLGPVPGTLGTLQASEALKLLLGLVQPAVHPLVLINLLDLSVQKLPIDPAAGCDLHGGCRDVAARGMQAARDAASIDLQFPDIEAAVAAGYSLVDVRETDETMRSPVAAPVQHVPSGDLPAQAQRLPAGPVLLLCATGKRSGHAARQLHAQGFTRVRSLKGGLQSLAGSRPGNGA